MPTDERWREGPGLLASVRRHPLTVLAVTLVLAAAGYVLAQLEPTTYEASARMFLTDLRTQTTVQQSRVLDPERNVPQQTERVQSRTALSRASELLGGDRPPSRLRAQLRVQGEPEVNLITVTASASTAEGAADLANAVARAYMQVTEEQTVAKAQEAIAELEQAARQIRSEIEILQNELALEPDDALAVSRLEVRIAQLTDNESRQQQIGLDAIVMGSGVELFEEAEPQANPVAPKPMRTALIAALLGFIFGAAIAYWRAGRSQELRSHEDAERILGVPMLAEIPIFDHRTPQEPGEIVSDTKLDEAYGFALASIEFALRARGGGRVLITSPAPRDGKTQTTLRLALAAASGGRDILLVDADLRAHGLTRLLGAQDLPGLMDVAAGVTTLKDCVHSYRVRPDVRLRVVGIGTPRTEATQLLRSTTFADAMDELRDLASAVVVDSAPILAVADTTVLAGHVDGIVLVLPQHTPAGVLQEVRDRLAFVTRPLLGFIYITATPQAEIYRYAYGYGVNPTTRRRGWAFWRRRRSPVPERSAARTASDRRPPDRPRSSSPSGPASRS
ncbi:MAG: hypothetical protein KY469_01900 [Actinobacteria bacterium]|nr:hypothetical protein [Actinomycetota bacterium]